MLLVNVFLIASSWLKEMSTFTAHNRVGIGLGVGESKTSIAG
tara:strand:+ start:244 stop:369 length:126 start_codon:yes stop_codon:yes gene_type:complete